MVREALPTLTATMSAEPVTTYEEQEDQNHEAVGGNKTAGENEDVMMQDRENGSHVQENANDNNKGVVEEEEEKIEEEEEEQLEESRMFRLLMRRKCCARILRTFPRFFALFLGVVIPLFSLIFISMLFGNLLSKLESPDEVNANDAILAAQMQARVFSFIMVNSSVIIPPKCTELFLGDEPHDRIGDRIRSAIIGGLTGSLDVSMALNDYSDQPSQTFWNETSFTNETVSISHEELFNYMKSCGESARNVSQTFFNSVTDAVNNASADLSFNWIRCYEGAYDLSYHDSFQPANPAYLPEAQENFYKETWQSDQERLFFQYFNESVDLRNMNHTNATINALNYSIHEATGGSRCNTNGPSGAWFWFTIMTTVGYGNQYPQTQGGKLMVFSLGFLSILAFGAVLASSGYIVSRIFDDAVNRAELKFLSWPWVACLIWGSAYYTWMALIAFHTKDWKNKRLGDESFSMDEGYWFSYISTTSVGLGDIYLEPEVLIGVDLIVFPLLFLTGFTFLSAFLGKFSEAIVSLLKGNKKGLIDSLLDQMDKENSSATTSKTTSPQGDSSSDSEMGKSKGTKLAC